MRISRIAGAVGGALVGLALGSVRPARATIAADVAAVERSVRPNAAQVELIQPRFLEEGDVARVSLPPLLPAVSGCRVVVLVSAPSVRFTAGSVAGALGAAPSGDVTTSSAGLLRLDLCGALRDQVSAVLITMASPRGAVAGLVVDGPGAEIDLTAILPDRSREPTLPPRFPGPALPVAPLDVRVEAFGERARRRGYVPSIELDVARTGTHEGVVALELTAGCHMVTVSVSPSGANVDADLVLEVAESRRVLGSDRTEASDASLRVCLAEPTPVTAHVRASHAFDEGRLSVASRPLPPAVDPSWGALPTATLATLLSRRAGPVPEAPAMAEVVGVQGSTELSFEPVVGRCYLAGLALLRGPSRGMRLRANVEGHALAEETPRTDDGVGLVACSTSGRPFQLAVDVPSPQAWWLLSIWSLSGAP